MTSHNLPQDTSLESVRTLFSTLLQAAANPKFPGPSYVPSLGRLSIIQILTLRSYSRHVPNVFDTKACRNIVADLNSLLSLNLGKGLRNSSVKLVEGAGRMVAVRILTVMGDIVVILEANQAVLYASLLM